MTWCSENSTPPGLRLASSAIHCRFVDRFAGFIVPSRVSRQWVSPRGASLSSFGSRRARFPALSSTMKALRLPTRVSTVAYWFAPAAHTILLLSCSPQRSRRVGGPLQARALGSAGCPSFRQSHAWTRMGSLRSSGDPSHAFALFHDPGRTGVPSPLTVSSVLPPLPIRRRLRRWLISGLTHSFGTCCPTLHAWRCRTRARLASGWLAGLGREGVEPSGSLRKVSVRFDDHPPFLLS